MSVSIINNRIDGLLITIYDIVHYLEAGKTAADIVDILPLTLEQVETTIRYIDDHKEEVMTVHRQIEKRIARGNPPEIEARARASRAKMNAWLQDRQQGTTKGQNGEGHPGRH